MTNSVCILYSDASDVIEKLAATLSHDDLSEKMQESCAFSFFFLANSGNLNKLL
jgi:hypothetical protein